MNYNTCGYCRHIRLLPDERKACFRYPPRARTSGTAVHKSDGALIAFGVYPEVTDDTIACGEFQRPDYRAEYVIRQREAGDAA